MDSKTGSGSSSSSSSTTTSATVAAPPLMAEEAAAWLQEGINILLSRWTALQMAVLNEWGGPHSNLKSQQLGLDLFTLLTQSKEKVYIDDVEDFLDDAMLTLGTEIDDGSVEEIAEKLMMMHEGCVEGDFSSIQELKATKPPKSGATRVLKATSDSDDDDYDDNDGNHENSANGGSSSMMIDDVPQLRSNASRTDPNDESMPEAEDGWTVVAPKRNKGRRN